MPRTSASSSRIRCPRRPRRRSDNRSSQHSSSLKAAAPVAAFHFAGGLRPSTIAARHPIDTSTQKSPFFSRADQLIAPLLLFVALYCATLFALVWFRFPLLQWTGLISVTVATAGTVPLYERGRWPLGLFVTPRRAVPEFLFGSIWGFVLILSCAALVIATTDVAHVPGSGFPWREVVLVFVPAALHEELLFRGYPFQKLHERNRWVAIGFVALIFAGLHAGNAAVTPLGLINIFLGGVLLSLAWERYRRLWFPIGLHLAWNLTTGPILGHEVSGYEALHSLYVERGSGPAVLTGGDFGIEGSILMTATELVAIALLVRKAHRPE